jgi:hypothetical protein
MEASVLVRPPEIVLILLSIVVLVFAGFGPLFGSHDRHDAISQECEMFYGPSGRDAVARCLTEMTLRSGAAAGVATRSARRQQF